MMQYQVKITDEALADMECALFLLNGYMECDSDAGNHSGDGDLERNQEYGVWNL